MLLCKDNFIKNNDKVGIYEDVLITTSSFQNPFSEIKKIARFLGKECSDSFAEEVAEKCNIENVRKAEEEIRKNKHGFMYRKGYYQPTNKNVGCKSIKTSLSWIYYQLVTWNLQYWTYWCFRILKPHHAFCKTFLYPKCTLNIRFEKKHEFNAWVVTIFQGWQNAWFSYHGHALTVRFFSKHMYKSVVKHKVNVWYSIIRLTYVLYM